MDFSQVNRPGTTTEPRPASSGRTRLMVGLGAVLAVAVIAAVWLHGVGRADAGRPPADQGTNAIPEQSNPTGTPASAPATTADPGVHASGSVEPFGDGTYRVGVDIAPGLWTTVGPLDETTCWYRVNGQSQIEVTIGRTVVDLARGDRFETAHCAQWRYAGSN
ncbi:MAG TPA: hypothetical protein VHA75_03880 [Rugosimonospora sp.]|nr:hypothetical protein [Rugosimonospora sp.]